MRICYIADARSPIARNWISYVVEHGHEVHILASYPCAPDALPGAIIHQAAYGLNSLARIGHDGRVRGKEHRSMLSAALAEFRAGRFSQVPAMVRGWLGPWELKRHVPRLRQLIREIAPDLVHAMRLPFEGIAAALAVEEQPLPLLLSIWGNDLTLHASRYPPVGRLVRRALRRADALHCDCRRDVELAVAWGFDPGKPSCILPGGGGVQHDLAEATLEQGEAMLSGLRIPRGVPLAVNARGFRAYVRNDTFFRAIPLVLQAHPTARFLALGMNANPIAERWARELRITRSLRLLPVLPREQVAALFRACQVALSPAEHDGTPNTLLECMAAGCFPIAGDIPSIREWIEPGVNGFLADPGSPEQFAEATIRALNDEPLRKQAAERNRQLILRRAEHGQVMAAALDFYELVASASGAALGRG